MFSLNTHIRYKKLMSCLGVSVLALTLQACGGGGGGDGGTTNTGGGSGGGSGGGTGSGGGGSTSSLPTLWMSATGQFGVELYGSDGTESGTTLIKDINPTGNSNPGSFNAYNKLNYVMLNGFMYFTANDGTHGVELWKSDGTANGTTLVKDINLGVASSNPSELTLFGNTIYFVATDSINGTELWKSDGTEAGTVLVSDINVGVANSSPSQLTVVGNAIYFAATHPTYGYELWKSDGTVAGTVLVKDINPGVASSNLMSMVAMGGNLYFGAYTPANGWELWKSNGTTSGTNILVDLNPGVNAISGAYNTFPQNLVVKGNEIYFTANNVPQTGNLIVFNGTQIWKSDGTAAGTIKLKDLPPPATGGGSYPGNLTVAGNLVYFTGFYQVTGTLNSVPFTVSYGTELWKTDGTVNGTVMVKDIVVGAGSGLSYAPVLTAVGSSVFFVANNGSSGAELWFSDGTDAGTHMVKDINPGAGNSNPRAGTAGFYSRTSFAVSGNTVYFIADDGVNTSSLWKSDGTEAGTSSVINMGSVNASSVSLLIN